MSRSGPSLPVANSSPAGIPAPGAGVGPSVPVTDSIKALRFILTGLKATPAAQRAGLCFRSAGQKSWLLPVACRRARAASQRIGSAQQLIQIPDLTKTGLALSGIIAHGIDPASDVATSAALDSTGAGLLAGPPKISEAEGSPAETVVVQPGPESRRLRRGLALEYSYSIFNAKRDPATGRTGLQTRALIFRDGQQIWAGEPKPVEPDGESSTEPVKAMGRLLLGAEMTPGEYVLQVVVTDRLAGSEKATATQWIDFEVVK
jgi:hypothetical protein